ncbi:hypothetical protein [Mesorhizobium sp. CAU 1741]|uniref:hypothetical protein n=1 Tax=Mesorhizobium sp. CAU 1741 TaxID=3140366 RepID=UPI00325B88BC
MQITFKVDHRPDGQSPDRPSYKAGKTYDFTDPVGLTYARKYVAQGLAFEESASAHVVAAVDDIEAAPVDDAAALEAALRGELKALTNAQLHDRAKLEKIAVESNDTKPVLVDKIVAGIQAKAAAAETEAATA